MLCPQSGQRIHRVRRSLTTGFTIIHDESGLSGNCRSHHGEALIGAERSSGPNPLCLALGFLLPIDTRLKYACSPGIFHGIALPLPITPLRARATMSVRRGWVMT